MKNKIAKLIEATKGRYFTLEFVKKDGTKRIANTKAKDIAHLRGGENTVANAGYLTAWDRNANHFVAFKPENVTRIKCGKCVDYHA
jgi:hypothetical protein